MSIIRIISLSTKLTLISIALVVIPVLAIGAHSLWFLMDFSSSSLKQSSDSLKEQALATLQTGVEIDKQRIESLVQIGQNDIIQFAA